MGEREQRRLRRVDRTGGDGAAGEWATSVMALSARTSTTEVRSWSRVAHRDRVRLATRRLRGEASGAHPGERRVPRDIDVAGEVCFGLGLVARVQHVVEREVLGGEPVLEALPDRDDLRVVGNGAERERSCASSRPSPEQRHAAECSADELLQRVDGRRHHRRGASVAEVALDTDVLAERGAAADPHREVEHLERGARRRRPSTAASAAARRPGRSPSAAIASSTSAAAASARFFIAATCWRVTGWSASDWSRCSNRAERDVRDRLGDRGVHQPEAARRVQDLEHRQHDAERDVEPAAVVAESGAIPASGRRSAATGLEALPRRPSPSNGPPPSGPAVSEGTSHSEAPASPSAGWLVQTYESASPAEVTQLLAASSTTSSPSMVAVPNGAQKWLREPVSEKASVDRCDAGGDRPADVVRAELLDHRSCAVVHADHHGGASAGGCEAAHDLGGVAETRPCRRRCRAGKAEQARLAEPLDGGPWERAVGVDVGGGRLDGGGDDLLEHVEERRCAHVRAPKCLQAIVGPFPVSNAQSHSPRHLGARPTPSPSPRSSQPSTGSPRKPACPHAGRTRRAQRCSQA